ncbi:MAG: rod-binding protein [Thermoguttaceae bacterium]
MINAINANLSATDRFNAAESIPVKMLEAGNAAKNPRLRKAFDGFVGETFFSQMLRSMRKTVGKPAFFNGGRAEEIFQQQLDQILAEKISQNSADKFSGPMFELFTLQRK